MLCHDYVTKSCLPLREHAYDLARVLAHCLGVPFIGAQEGLWLEELASDLPELAWFKLRGHAVTNVQGFNAVLGPLKLVLMPCMPP